MRRRTTVKRRPFKLVVTAAALLCAGAYLSSGNVFAQVIDFGQIETFESLGTGTQRGESPPKTIVDDGDRHMVFITILEANTEARVYWNSLDGDPVNRATIIPGPGVQMFQTAGELSIEALGDQNHSVKYGYMLFRLRKK
jgi:hypothetical protein